MKQSSNQDNYQWIPYLMVSKNIFVLFQYHEGIVHYGC